jgi:hypothetical protein
MTSFARSRAPDATVREDEGLAVVLRREQADRLGIALCAACPAQLRQ